MSQPWQSNDKPYASQITGLFAIGCGLMILGLAIAVLCNFLFAWPFMWVWNLSVVPAFKTQEIEYWTAFWLMFLLSWLRTMGNFQFDFKKTSE